MNNNVRRAASPHPPHLTWLANPSNCRNISYCEQQQSLSAPATRCAPRVDGERQEEQRRAPELREPRRLLLRLLGARGGSVRHAEQGLQSESDILCLRSLHVCVVLFWFHKA